MFFSLLAGLLMAFAFQLLLTNLGVALGLSALGWAIAPSVGTSRRSQADSSRATKASAADDATDGIARSPEAAGSENEGSVPPVSHLLGLGVTLTLAPVLFATAFLATTFSGIVQLPVGLIFGLILWAAYVLILIWISSITVSGILDFVLGTATEGIRRLFSGVAQVFRSEDTEDDAADLQRTMEVLSAEIRQTLSAQQELPVLLAQQRKTLLKEICDRTNLDRDQAELVLESIESDADSVRPEDSGPKDSGLKNSGPKDSGATRITTGDISAEVSIDAEGKFGGASKGAALARMLPDWRELLRMAVSRVDATDLDIETAWNTFQRFTDDGGGADFNVIALDAENYLREAPVYSLQADTLSEEFAERIYDPEADPGAVAQQLQVLEKQDFSDWLKARGDLAEDVVEALSDQLAAVRADVLTQAEEKAERLSQSASTQLASTQSASTQSALAAESASEAVMALSETEKAAAEAAVLALEEKLTAYFRYTALSKLSSRSVEDKLNDLGREIEAFETRASDWVKGGVMLDFEALTQTLSRRKGITKEQQNELIVALETAWRGYELQADALPLSEQMTNYLQAIDWSEARLEDLKDEILQQIQTGVSSPGGFSQSLDVGKIMASLSIPKTVKSDLLSLLKNEGLPLLKRPRRWAVRAASTSQDWGARLARQMGQYLAYQDFSIDLDTQPEQIVREASQMVQSATRAIPAEQLPHLGAEFWRQALAHRPNLDSVDVGAMASRLAEVWDATAQTLPQLTERLKTQSAEQLQAVQAVAQSLTHFVDNGVLDPVLDAVPELDALLEPAREKFVAALDLAQDSLAQQTALVAQDLQKRAEQVRRQVAIAAWWLFISLFTSGAAAAAGGWLAVWMIVKT